MKFIIIFALITVLTACQSVSPATKDSQLFDDVRHFCEKELLGAIMQKQVNGQISVLCQFTDKTGKVQTYDAYELLRHFAGVMIQGDTSPKM